MASCVLVLTGASLPENGPVPVPRPAERAPAAIDPAAGEASKAAQSKDAVPKGADPADPKADPKAHPTAEAEPRPARKPVPPPASADRAPEAAGSKEADTAKTDTDRAAGEKPDAKAAGKTDADEAEEKEALPPLVREDDATFAACIGALKAGGAIIEETAPVEPKNGCGITRPIVLKRLSTDVEIKPEATLRCETALQLQRWIKGSIAPAIEASTPEKKLAGLEQASAYVCRNRNNAASGKVSEHAYGNAVDIAAFEFSDGSRLDIAPREKDSTIEGALQRAAVATACLYFTTVLDPGSDAAHETHLHLDVIKRKSGYRYCW